VPSRPRVFARNVGQIWRIRHPLLRIVLGAAEQALALASNGAWPRRLAKHATPDTEHGKPANRTHHRVLVSKIQPPLISSWKLAIMSLMRPSIANRIPRCASQITAMVFATALAFATPVRADGFRCGVHLVDPGMQVFEVLDACGDPEQVTRSSIQRPEVVWLHGRAYTTGAFVDVSVETWVYNFGSTRLMQQLRFENSVLVEVIALDYGYQREAH